jgi:hypothetical protein
MFDFPNAPTVGAIYSPAGGPSWQWDGTVWKLVSSVAIADAPSDGNEYVRVNGVWRLKHQMFNPTGAAGQNITVPVPAKAARVYGKIYLGTQPSAPLLRASADGSTFLSGASDYSVASTTLPTGTGTSPAKAVAAAASGMPLATTTDVTNIPVTFDLDLMVSKPASPALFGARWHGSSYNTNAATGYVDVLGNGYLAAAAFTALTQLPAFQIIPSGGSWAAGSLIKVEWVY